MKKLIIIFFLITIPLFGQNKEYRKATDFYNSEQFYQANFILEKLLNKEYGDLDEKMEFQILYMNAGCVFSFNEYNKALLKYNELIDFVKKSKNIFANISDKEKSIVDIEKLITDTKLKIPGLIDSLSISNETLESSSEIKTQSDENEIGEIPIEATDNKTVTLTVSGTGKTIEDAKLNALRSAIEQAFGAFISSKTEILNDKLVKDEIVSISNGNVQKYDLVSQAEVPNIGYAITLSATVSITKLTSFAESKGVVVEFKGGMFGLKIKLQKLNEDSEFIAVKNLLSQTFEMLENSIDYSINVTEPKLVPNNLYSVGIEVIEKKNLNYDNCMSYLIQTLNKIALDDSEANEITKNGKDLGYLWIDGQYLKFRNEKSINALFNFSVICSMLASNTFCIKNNFGVVKIPTGYKARIFSSYVTDNPYIVGANPGSIKKINFGKELIKTPDEVYINGVSFIQYVKKNGFHIDKLMGESFIDNYYNTIMRKNKFLQIVHYFNYSIDDKRYTRDKEYGDNLYYKLNYNLSDIEKIESFQIVKIPFVEMILKRELFRSN